jgi:hypothetical protein
MTLGHEILLVIALIVSALIFAVVACYFVTCWAIREVLKNLW